MAEFDPDAFLAKQDKKEKRGAFDPDAFLAKTQPETLGKGVTGAVASVADTALNMATGAIEAFNYPFNLAYRGVVQGKPLAQASAEAQQAVSLPKDIVGRALGVNTTRSYANAPQRQAGEFIGEQVSENVIQPAAEKFNVPEEYVGNMLNSLAMGVAPVAGRATAATGRAVKATAQVPVDVAKGALGRATGYIAEPGVAPTGYQVPSSRIPLGETFIPAKEMAELQRGMPISEGAVRPINELAPAPVLALSGGEIPVAGRAAQAYGERLGETYRDPITAAADIGSMFLTGGVPVLTAGRGALGLAQAGADAYLARKGFTGLTPEQTIALNQGTNPFFTAGPVTPKAQPAPAPTVTTQAVEPPALPQLTYNPTQPVMYASESGVVGRTPQAVVEADLAQRYAPQPVAAVAPETVVAQPVKPLGVTETVGKTVEQLAAEQQILDFINARRGATPEPTPAPLPEKKKYISQEQRIREREAMMTPEELAAQQAEVERNLAKSRGKPATTTTAKPEYASPSEMRKALIGTMSSDQLENLIKQTFPSADTLKQKMTQPKTSEDVALNEALRQRLEALKSQGKYKPPGTMEMMSDNVPPANRNAIAGLSDDAQYKVTDNLHKHGNFANPLTAEEAMNRKTLHQFGMGGDLDYNITYKTNDGNTVVMNQYEKTPKSAQPEYIAKSVVDKNTTNQSFVRFSKDGDTYIVAYSEPNARPLIVKTKEKPSIWMGEFDAELPAGFKNPTSKDQFHDIFGYGDAPSQTIPKLKNYVYDEDISRHVHGESTPLNEMDAVMRGKIQSTSRPGQDYEIIYKKGKNIISEKSFIDDGEIYVNIKRPDGTSTSYSQIDNSNVGFGKTNVKSGKMYGYKEFDKNENITHNTMSHSRPTGMPNILGK